MNTPTDKKIRAMFSDLDPHAKEEVMKHLTDEAAVRLASVSKEFRDLLKNKTNHIKLRHMAMREALEFAFKDLTQQMYRPFPINKNDEYFFTKVDKEIRGILVPEMSRKGFNVTRNEKAAYKLAAKKFIAKYPEEKFIKFSKNNKVNGLGNRKFKTADERFLAEAFLMYDKALKYYTSKK